MKLSDDELLKDGKISIVNHVTLNNAYLEWYKNSNRKTYLNYSMKRVKAAWRAVLRDDRFHKTNLYIRSSFMSIKETNHPIYQLEEKVKSNSY